MLAPLFPLCDSLRVGVHANVPSPETEIAPERHRYVSLTPHVIQVNVLKLFLLLLLFEEVVDISLSDQEFIPIGWEMLEVPVCTSKLLEIAVVQKLEDVEVQFWRQPAEGWPLR